MASTAASPGDETAPEPGTRATEGRSGGRLRSAHSSRQLGPACARGSKQDQRTIRGRQARQCRFDLPCSLATLDDSLRRVGSLPSRESRLGASLNLGMASAAQHEVDGDPMEPARDVVRRPASTELTEQACEGVLNDVLRDRRISRAGEHTPEQHLPMCFECRLDEAAVAEAIPAGASAGRGVRVHVDLSTVGAGVVGGGVPGGDKERPDGRQDGREAPNGAGEARVERIDRGLPYRQLVRELGLDPGGLPFAVPLLDAEIEAPGVHQVRHLRLPFDRSAPPRGELR
jgi:hypothetical protein